MTMRFVRVPSFKSLVCYDMSHLAVPYVDICNLGRYTLFVNEQDGRFILFQITCA